MLRHFGWPARVAGVMALLALAACSDSDTGNNPNRPDTGAQDVPTQDLPGADTGALDTGGVDTGAADTGGVDTGAADTGAPDVAADTAVADTSPQDTGAPDTAVPDTGAADTGAVDTGVDAAPPRCASNADCSPALGGPACDVATGRCVACVPSADTCPADQHCDAATNACVPGCRGDEGCAAGDAGVGDGGVGARYCDVAAHACVACRTDEHCAPGTVCMAGACVPGCTDARPCPGGAACCPSGVSGACVDTRATLAHCGACGVACATPRGTPACEGGACRVARCDEGFGDCDANAANGCETDTRATAAHCGACGASCAVPNASGACAMGACGCAAPFLDCDATRANGCETDPRGDEAHCGACGRACTAAGSACVAGACAADCRRAGAVACAAGTACDFTDGQCRPAPGMCLLTGEFRACGAQSCGPGTTCDPETSRCVVHTSCRAVECDGARCWGRDCPCERPAGSCRPAATAPGAFLSGAFGFDIDDACNMYVSTMLSGPDYVRRLSPAGVVTTWTSVANLNMGEVAVQRRVGGEYGGEATSEVAFTYICCASCGCASSPPQGVGHVSGTTLPVVVPATTTTGAGPFGDGSLDTGPYGLGISASADFFIGNVRTNGDYFRYDPPTRAVAAIATLPRRVYASTAYDLQNMLVAVQGGELYVVPTLPGATPRLLGTLGADVTSMRRDPFTGRFYASLRGGRIVSFAADATGVTGVTTFQMAAGTGRIALGPDGGLYFLRAIGGPITRYDLPRTR